MSTPHDPQRDGRQQAPYGNQPGPYGQQPGQYGQRPGPSGQQPGQYGQQPGQVGPYGGQPQQPSPYAQTGRFGPGPGPGPYGSDAPVYSPYSTPYPAGLDTQPDEPVGRPGIMMLALVLLILSTLPFLFSGIVLLLVPLTPDTIPPGVLDDPALVRAGATPELLVSALRAGGVVVLVLGLLYILMAALSFLGRNWARIVLTIMSTGSVLLLGFALVSGPGSDAASALLLGAILFLAVVGTILLFLPPSARYYARR